MGQPKAKLPPTKSMQLTSTAPRHQTFRAAHCIQSTCTDKRRRKCRRHSAHASKQGGTQCHAAQLQGEADHEPREQHAQEESFIPPHAPLSNELQGTAARGNVQAAELEILAQAAKSLRSSSNTDGVAAAEVSRLPKWRSLLVAAFVVGPPMVAAALGLLRAPSPCWGAINGLPSLPDRVPYTIHAGPSRAHEVSLGQHRVWATARSALHTPQPSALGPVQGAAEYRQALVHRSQQHAQAVHTVQMHRERVTALVQQQQQLDLQHSRHQLRPSAGANLALHVHHQSPAGSVMASTSLQQQQHPYLQHGGSAAATPTPSAVVADVADRGLTGLHAHGTGQQAPGSSVTGGSSLSGSCCAAAAQLDGSTTPVTSAAAGAGEGVATATTGSHRGGSEGHGKGPTVSRSRVPGPSPGSSQDQGGVQAWKVVAAVSSTVALLVMFQTAAKRAERERMLQRPPPPSDADDVSNAPPSTLQTAREEWERSMKEEWWKSSSDSDSDEAGDWWNRPREEWGMADSAAVVSGTASTASAAATPIVGNGADAAQRELSPAEQWQAVMKEEWWKTDGLKDDPQWWNRDREEWGLETVPSNNASVSPSTSVNGSNGSTGTAPSSPEGGANTTLPQKLTREATFLADSAKARLMALKLALTRPARQKAFEKQEKGQCDYEVDPDACNDDQRVFLRRKDLAARGEGPLLPEDSYCTRCSGTGQLTCWHCDGSGRNSRGVEEIMGTTMDKIIPRNGIVEVRWNLMKGGPCFLCQGRNACVVGCPDCQGTGIVGYIVKYKE